MGRRPSSVLILLLAGCAGSANMGLEPVSSSRPERPTWIDGPSPVQAGRHKCYRESVSEFPKRDEAMQTAKKRAVSQIVEELQVQVDSKQVAYQEERDGALSVWVGEETVQRAIGEVWGLVEKDRYWESYNREGKISYDAHVQVCVPLETFAQMKAALAERTSRLESFVREKVDGAERALAEDQIFGISDELAVTKRALLELSAASNPTELVGRIQSIESRLAHGLVLQLAPGAPTKIAAAKGVELRLRAEVRFEGRPVAGVRLSCEASGGPCAVSDLTNEQGSAELALGPIDTIGQAAVKLDLAALSPQGAQLAQLAHALTVVASPRSVLVCGASEAGATMDALESKLVTWKLDVFPRSYCGKERGVVRTVLEVSPTQTQCKDQFGDRSCSAKGRILMRDPSAARSLGEVKVSRAFVHPDESEARTAVEAQIPGALISKLYQRLRSHVAKLERQDRKSKR